MSFRVKVEPLNNLDRGNGNGRLRVLYSVSPSTGHTKNPAVMNSAGRS
jgi:hypothetical protein